jgi:carboxylesterase type B
MYNFNIPWSISRDGLGASHASEISHVFGTPYMETPENAQVGATMNAYWASFARSGNPNFPGSPAEWPRFMPDANGDNLRLQLDPKFEVLRSFHKEECALWREIAN